MQSEELGKNDHIDPLLTVNVISTKQDKAHPCILWYILYVINASYFFFVGGWGGVGVVGVGVGVVGVGGGVGGGGGGVGVGVGGGGWLQGLSSQSLSGISKGHSDEHQRVRSW